MEPEKLLEHLANIETWFSSAGPGVKIMGTCWLAGLALKASFGSFPVKGARPWLMWLIPWLLLALAILSVSWYASPGIVDPDVSDPEMALRATAVFYWGAQWLLHKLVISRWLDSRLFGKDKEGNTEFLKRTNK